MNLAVPKLQHHFEDLPKQAHAARLGMWLFLASEALFFSGLFTLYAAYRAHYPEIFREGVAHNDLVLGTVNTFILLTGSLFLSLALWALRAARRALSVLLTAATGLAGLVYLIIKATEWAHHMAEGIFPGGRGRFFVENPEPAWAIFYTSYYGLTGFHAIHVTVGVGILAWTAWWMHRERVGPAAAYKLAIVGLYWHFVDIVWLFLWPLFYLLRNPA
ncbi:MAG: cytochrome c oxidase subunit 3 [Pseudomonadota bacterium]|nr:MAG: cytochrome C oxidase subunit III [Pseudomonadota bacterium]